MKVNLIFGNDYNPSKPHMSKTKDAIHQYPCIENINRKNEASCLWYSSTKSVMFVPKIVFGRFGYNIFIDYHGEYGLCPDCAGIADTIDNLEAMKKVMLSKQFTTFMDSFNRKVVELFKKDFWKEIHEG